MGLERPDIAAAGFAGSAARIGRHWRSEPDEVTVAFADRRAERLQRHGLGRTWRIESQWIELRIDIQLVTTDKPRGPICVADEDVVEWSHTTGVVRVATGVPGYDAATQ